MRAFKNSLLLSPSFVILVGPWLLSGTRPGLPVLYLALRWVWLAVLLTVFLAELWLWSKDKRAN
jgi:hypothetical protein